MTPRTIAIVGGSLAGLSAARQLRAEGFAGTITIVDHDPDAPYDRPPLSKDFLRLNPVVLDLESDEPLDAQRVTGIVVGLDAGRRDLRLADGSVIGFDGLVIASGAHARRVPAPDLIGIHTLRTLEDARGLASRLGNSSGVAIIGGGFIGVEVAASCRILGIPVTVIEASEVPLGRVVGDEVGRAIAEVHEQHGVTMRTNSTVVEIIGVGHVEGVRLQDGSIIAADTVIVAVGVTPSTAWLDGSGVAVDNGVICDETLAVAPGIVAAGDVARWPNSRFGEFRRIEHWENAITSGEHAARTLLAGFDGRDGVPYAPIPWVWSDQYDRKFQLVGSTLDHDEVAIVRGDLDSLRFLAIYRRGDEMIGAFASNQAKLIQRCRVMLREPVRWKSALAELDPEPHVIAEVPLASSGAEL